MTAATTDSAPPQSPFRRAVQRLVRKKVAMVALAIIVLLYLAGIFAPLVAPHDYNETNLRRVRQGPSAENWLGTDSLGATS